MNRRHLEQCCCSSSSVSLHLRLLSLKSSWKQTEAHVSANWPSSTVNVASRVVPDMCVFCRMHRTTQTRSRNACLFNARHVGALSNNGGPKHVHNLLQNIFVRFNVPTVSIADIATIERQTNVVFGSSRVFWFMTAPFQDAKQDNQHNRHMLDTSAAPPSEASWREATSDGCKRAKLFSAYPTL